LVIAYTDNDLDCYLVGRQFIVVLVNFVVSNAGGGLSNVSFPHLFTPILLRSGKAMTFVTAAMICQLSSGDKASLSYWITPTTASPVSSLSALR
jgi:hypothetical protein